MAGKIYSGTYTTTVLLTNSATQNPGTLTGAITVNGTNASSDSGFYSSTDFAWAITNLGRITATGATSYGIALLAGGTIQNGASGSAGGSITSGETGIFLTGAAGSVTNLGQITGLLGRGVFLEDGGTVVNGSTGGTAASITGGFEGVAIYNAGGALSNFGTILATGSAGFGVELYAGTVANQAGGQIGGIYGVGFVARSTAGTLTNAGTITGRGRDGVALTGGGTLGNNGTINGAIAGVLALYGTAAVTNSGSIGGVYAGIDMLVGGTVTNQAGGRITGSFGVSAGNGTLATAQGTVINAGIITGSTYEGVSLGAGGALTNSGSIFGHAGGAVAFYGAAAVTNSGSIGSDSIGVKLGAGGTLTNAAHASISGLYGIVLANGAIAAAPATATVLSNAGTITGSGTFGADILTNGRFTNASGGVISGGRYGISIQSVTGTIANYGVISGQLGVYAREVVANYTAYPGQLTIINAGTIIGSAGTSVSLFNSNDLLIDKPGAVFTGTVVGGSGRLELTSGVGTLGGLASGIASFATVTVDQGGAWDLGGSLDPFGTLVDQGLVTVAGTSFGDFGLVTGTGTLAVGHNGFVVLGGTATSGVTVSFVDHTSLFGLLNGLIDSAVNQGFSAGNTLALANVTNSGLTKSYTGTSSGGTLTINQSGTAVARLAFRGNYTAASFNITTDPIGGTDISIPCFLAGTRIALADGELPVESLRTGMQVLTASGALREITWLGRRQLDVAHHPEPKSVQPVRIRSNAFGPGLPRRDLILSPDHAVFHAGALIPVHLLINGGSVRRETMACARYHHVELARHDILLAEGLPVESFLDTGNRGVFDGGSAAGPAFRPGPCAPFVLAGTALARARRHLLVQSRGRGGKSIAGPLVVARGVGLPPARRIDRRLLYLLPEGTGQVYLPALAPSQLAGVLLDGALLRVVPDQDGGSQFAVNPDPGGKHCLELILAGTQRPSANTMM